MSILLETWWVYRPLQCESSTLKNANCRGLDAFAMSIYRKPLGASDGYSMDQTCK